MLPEQRSQLYRLLGKKPPHLDRDELEAAVKMFVGDGWISVAENLRVRCAKGRATWVVRCTQHGRECTLTLGEYTDERGGDGTVTYDDALNRAEWFDSLRQSSPDMDLRELFRDIQRANYSGPNKKYTKTYARLFVWVPTTEGIESEADVDTDVYASENDPDLKGNEVTTYEAKGDEHIFTRNGIVDGGGTNDEE